MSTETTTFLAYGVHIPLPARTDIGDEADRVEDALRAWKEQCPDVRCLTAETLTGDHLFLTTRCEHIAAGTFRTNVTSSVISEHIADWKRQLNTAVHALGYHQLPGLSEPDWMVVNDYR
ncbi:hypothetical protein AB0D59_47305 [Streptomyces sp. NPDC048417]|uniref:hypothetical protein n=1 Tax=Streptomyces sp. NPDC048417 TaxID=3155387 RepID=UPI00343AF927